MQEWEFKNGNDTIRIRRARDGFTAFELMPHEFTITHYIRDEDWLHAERMVSLLQHSMQCALDSHVRARKAIRAIYAFGDLSREDDEILRYITIAAMSAWNAYIGATLGAYLETTDVDSYGFMATLLNNSMRLQDRILELEMQLGKLKGKHSAVEQQLQEAQETILDLQQAPHKMLYEGVLFEKP